MISGDLRACILNESPYGFRLLKVDSFVMKLYVFLSVSVQVCKYNSVKNYPTSSLLRRMARRSHQVECFPQRGLCLAAEPRPEQSFLVFGDRTRSEIAVVLSQYQPGPQVLVRCRVTRTKFYPIESRWGMMYIYLASLPVPRLSAPCL